MQNFIKMQKCFHVPPINQPRVANPKMWKIKKRSYNNLIKEEKIISYLIGSGNRRRRRRGLFDVGESGFENAKIAFRVRGKRVTLKREFLQNSLVKRDVCGREPEREP